MCLLDSTNGVSLEIDTVHQCFSNAWWQPTIERMKGPFPLRVVVQEWVPQWCHRYYSGMGTQGHGKEPQRINVLEGPGGGCKPPAPSDTLVYPPRYLSMPLGSCSTVIAAALSGHSPSRLPVPTNTYQRSSNSQRFWRQLQYIITPSAIFIYFNHFYSSHKADPHPQGNL